MDRTATEEYVFGSILLLSNKIQVWGDNIISDLTLKQWFLLILISKMENKNPTLNEISEFTGTSRQNIKKMLGHLDEKKYLKIKKSKTDARALNVSLLKKTFDYFNDNEIKGMEAVNLLFSKITDEELSITCRTLEKLLLFLGNQLLAVSGEKLGKKRNQ
jgi:DNA-binding MarR family transcriptional regulator